MRDIQYFSFLNDPGVVEKGCFSGIACYVWPRKLQLISKFVFRVSLLNAGWHELSIELSVCGCGIPWLADSVILEMQNA